MRFTFFCFHAELLLLQGNVTKFFNFIGESTLDVMKVKCNFLNA